MVWGAKQGWRHSFGVLANSACGAQLEQHLEGVVNAFVDAWNERDSDTRTELLNASFAPDGSLCDPFAVVVGRDEMSDRIATAHACGSPGRLERSGPVQHCQATIHFGWRVRHTSGEAVASGTNDAELSLEANCAALSAFGTYCPRDGDVVGRAGRAAPADVELRGRTCAGPARRPPSARRAFPALPCPSLHPLVQ